MRDLSTPFCRGCESFISKELAAEAECDCGAAIVPGYTWGDEVKARAQEIIDDGDPDVVDALADLLRDHHLIKAREQRAAAKKARGHASIRVLAWIAASFIFAALVVAGHKLCDLDRAEDARRYAEEREAVCERGWHVTLSKSREFREVIAEHEREQSEAPCACWVAP